MESKSTEKQKPFHRGTQNLIPWKPGQSGNPAGRPKRKSFMDMAHAVLDEIVVDPDTGETMTKGELLVRKVIQDAITKGDPTALKELLARWEPAPKQNITVNNNVDEKRQQVLDLLDRMHVHCKDNGKPG